MDLLQLDVFADGPFRGNPLAVFPDAPDLTREQMQTIATEMNLSESTFVTASDSDSYSVRIFTPREELPFAGHPTLGTAWALRHLGRLTANEIVQRSPAGPTQVSFSDDLVWFARSGSASADLKIRTPEIDRKIAGALGLDVAEIGLEPRELGRSVARLNAAVSDAGIPHLMVPVRDGSALKRCRPTPHLLEELWDGPGAYCFTATAAGAIQARGFFPSLGIEEDPATGSAAACLGMYLASRVGAIDFELHQGVEMGRPSRMHVKAADDEVRIGGRCQLILEGALVTLP